MRFFIKGKGGVWDLGLGGRGGQVQRIFFRKNKKNSGSCSRAF